MHNGQVSDFTQATKAPHYDNIALFCTAEIDHWARTEVNWQTDKRAMDSVWIDCGASEMVVKNEMKRNATNRQAFIVCHDEKC